MFGRREEDAFRVVVFLPAEELACDVRVLRDHAQGLREGVRVGAVVGL